MDIRVSVLVSLENKTLQTDIEVPVDDWLTGPYAAVCKALRSDKNFDLQSIAHNKDANIMWGEIVGRLGMDMSHTLDLPFESAWMHVQLDAGQEHEQVLHFLSDLYDKFPVLDELVRCPVCYVDEEGMEECLSSLIPHLNDNHEWSRSQIADWLESTDLNLELR